MDGLSAAASIFAVLQATAEVIVYLKGVRDAPKECQRCQAEASNLHDLLNNLLFHLNQDRNDSLITNVRALTVENGPLDQYKQALQELLAKVEVKGRLQSIKRRLIWTFTKAEVKDILQRMERIKSVIGIALGSDHFALSKAIKEDTAIARTALPTLQADTDRIKHDLREQRNRKILEWVSPTDFSAQQHDIISQLQEGTGSWFLESPAFRKWMEGGQRTLFCPGIPGAGKTMIAALVISRLRDVQQKLGNVGVAYVFCSYKASMEQSVSNLLAALLKQLAYGHSGIAEAVMKLYDAHRMSSHRPSLNELSAAFISVCNQYSASYVVVDALDECLTPRGARDALLTHLRKIQTDTGVRLLCTSRPLPEITSHFKEEPALEIRARSQDIDMFVEGRMHVLPDCICSDNILMMDVKQKITTAVDGMFILARLYVESLADLTTAKEVRGKLCFLRSDADALDQAYEAVLERIDGQPTSRRQLAKRTISWLTFAQRLLTTEELRHALAIEPGERELDRGNFSSVKDIVSVCAGLVTIDEESDIVRLVHYTTEEYFARTWTAWIPEAQVELAIACLTYLCFDAFQAGSYPALEAREQRRGEHQFLEYATIFWSEHCRPVQKALSPQLAVSFLTNSDLVTHAKEARDKYMWDEKRGTRTTGLHLTAQYGLETFTVLMLKHADIDADAKDFYGLTALACAASEGHDTVVKCLLDSGVVDIDACHSDASTALILAAQYGHESVVELFLDRGANIEILGSRKRTPLSGAAERGQQRVVKLLLERGADINSSDVRGNTPLTLAAAMGHVATVDCLLENGAEVDSRGASGSTPLAHASKHGHALVAKLLLDKGAEINSKSTKGHTAIARAAKGGHIVAVKLLLHKGAEVNGKDKYGWTPLAQAVIYGHLVVAEVLLEYGVSIDIDSVDECGVTPLAHAAEQGHAAIVRLLLDKGARADLRDKWHRTPLMRASARDNRDVVALLQHHIDSRETKSDTASG